VQRLVNITDEVDDKGKLPVDAPRWIAFYRPATAPQRSISVSTQFIRAGGHNVRVRGIGDGDRNINEGQEEVFVAAWAW